MRTQSPNAHAPGPKQTLLLLSAHIPPPGSPPWPSVCEICYLKTRSWSFLLLDLIVYKFNTKFNPFSKKIHPKLSSVAAFYLPSKLRSGVDRYDEMRDLEKDRRRCSSTPPTQPCTRPVNGQTGPVRFRFGPVPNRPKFKI